MFNTTQQGDHYHGQLHLFLFFTLLLLPLSTCSPISTTITPPTLIYANIKPHTLLLHTSSTAATNLDRPIEFSLNQGDDIRAAVISFSTSHALTVPETNSLSQLVMDRIETHNAGANNIPFDVEVFDPVAMECFHPVLGNPTYFQKPGDVSDALKACSEKIAAADCYLVVTPEYNHSIPHGLTNMMNQFGGSKYGYKPSGCVCYSG